MEHFLVLFDELKNNFYLDDEEQKQHSSFAMAEFVSIHKKEILRAVNEAQKKGEDPQHALNEVFKKLAGTGEEDSD